MVQSIEELPAELENRSFGQIEVANQRQIQRLQSRTIHRVPSHIAKRVSRRRCKRSPVHPTGSSARSRRKDWLPGQIRADRILSQHCARVRRVSEDGNRKRKSSLHLVNGRNVLIFADRSHKARTIPRWNVIDHARGKRCRMSHAGPRSASRSLLFCGIDDSNSVAAFPGRGRKLYAAAASN